MRRRYRITPEAKRDVAAIWRFIALDDPAAATRVIERLDASFNKLARFPAIGHKRADVQTSDEVLFWVVGSYVVVYTAEPRPIVIVRVIHGARDLDALL